MGLADILAPMMTLLLYVIAKCLKQISDDIRQGHKILMQDEEQFFSVLCKIRDELRKLNEKEPK